MTDEELKITKGKLRILRNKYFWQVLKDFREVESTANAHPWIALEFIYGMAVASEKKPKYRQKSILEQIAEEKNENPTIEE